MCRRFVDTASALRSRSCFANGLYGCGRGGRGDGGGQGHGGGDGEGIDVGDDDISDIDLEGNEETNVDCQEGEV